MGPRLMRALALAILSLAAAACGSGEDSSGDAGGLVFPLAGTLDQDFFYVGMVDHAGAGTIEDYQCGERTYDGHTGTDIGLASFADMEAGVTISAALDGTVLETHDGEPDHNTSWVGQSGLGNYVAIDHGAGLVTYYGHMTNGSVAVTPGALVSAGDALGLVGSSGRSDLPHLHLELQRNGAVVDPFAGPCSQSSGEWASQDPYDLSLQVFDSGFTDQSLTLDLVKQPPVPKTTWSTSDSTLWFWVLVLNAEQGDVSEFAFYRPDGSPLGTVTLDPFDRYYAVSWWWVSYPIVGNFTQAGTWRVDYVYDGTVRSSSEFDVVSAASALTDLDAEDDEAGDTLPGSGGAGL